MKYRKIENGKYLLENASGVAFASITKYITATRTVWSIEYNGEHIAEGRSRPEALENAAIKNDMFYRYMD